MSSEDSETAFSPLAVLVGCGSSLGCFSAGCGYACASPEEGEDRREAGHEQEDAEQDLPPLEVRDVERGTRELGEKGGDHRQHARREERGEPGDEREDERWLGHFYAAIVLVRMLIGRNAPALLPPILTRACGGDNRYLDPRSGS